MTTTAASSSRASRLASTLVFALAAVPLFAQPVRESVTIEVVDVPVFVTRQNEPVRGLTRDDFELYVNGKRQPIEYFDVVDGVSSSAAPAAPSLRERRLFVLLFDLAFAAPHSLARAQRAAAGLIAGATPNDLFAVATFSPRRGVWFATPFTSDHVALARGIRHLGGSHSGDPLSLVLTSRERELLASFDDNLPDRARTQEVPDLMNRLSGEALRDIWQTQMKRAAEHQIRDFTDLTGRLATLQGQKHVVLLSEGFDNNRGRQPDIAKASRDASFAINDQRGYAANPGGFGWSGSSTHRYLREMAEAFQTHDVLLHTVDLKGVHSLMGNDALHVLATDTGGRFMHNDNNVGRMLTNLTKSYSHGYVLGFRPAATKRKHNTIEVKVKDLPRGTRVQFRRGFSGTRKAYDVNEGLYLADVVLNDVQQSGTAPRLTRVENRVEVRVPLAPVVAQLGGAGDAELLFYVFGADQVALGFRRVTIHVPAGATGEQSMKFELQAGARVAKALLRVGDSLGFSRSDL